VALSAAVVVVAATAVAHSESSDRTATAVLPDRLTARSASGAGTVLPGGALTGSVRITNPGPTTRRVEEVTFGPATSDACSRTGLSLGPTLAPTPEAPLEVPAGGAAVLGWAAYMDGTGDNACQGATLTSDVLLDGERAGTVTVTAGTLEQPPAPTGGLTTSTRAAVRWSPSTAAVPGWVVERARAGTDDWQPACGSSAARPVRAVSCTDTGLTRSTSYAYRVTLRTGHWRVTSRPSEPVTTQERPSA
jgi:hypothetical protein